MRDFLLLSRFRLVTKRVDLVRFRHLGSHVAEELSKLRELSEEIVPAALPAAPRFDPFNLNVIRPPNVPDGVVLPSVPSTEVLARPTTTLTTSDGKVSSSARGHPSSAPPLMLKEEAEKRGEGPAADERERADEVLGQMESNLKHMVQSYDSDATESSSGGESCDEGETYPEKNQDYVPIRRRAQWAWLTNRAGIASKWTWLTAQISDLEYRIRQQTEFYRQIRAAKGGVTLGEPVVSWPPHARKPVQSQVRPDRDVPLNCKPVTKDYSRVDSTGRKIIIKEPSSPQLESPQPPVVAAPPPPPPPPALMASPTPLSASDPDDNSLGACRTRPVKMIRRRRILSTQGIFRTSARAAKESTVRCDCIHPLFCCSICYGRLNHTQVPDPITQERNQCMALLDHSYHQVLSTVEDAPLDVLFMQKIKNRSWADPRSLGFARDEEGVRKRLKKVKKEEDGEKQSAGGSATADGEPIKKKKRLKVRPSKTKDGKKVVKKDGLKKKRPVVQHYNDDRGTFLNDMSSDGDTMSGADGNSPVHSPSVPSSNQVRKGDTSFSPLKEKERRGKHYFFLRLRNFFLGVGRPHTEEEGDRLRHRQHRHPLQHSGRHPCGTHQVQGDSHTHLANRRGRGEGGRDEAFGGGHHVVFLREPPRQGRTGGEEEVAAAPVEEQRRTEEQEPEAGQLPDGGLQRLQHARPSLARDGGEGGLAGGQHPTFHAGQRGVGGKQQLRARDYGEDPRRWRRRRRPV